MTTPRRVLVAALSTALVLPVSAAVGAGAVGHVPGQGDTTGDDRYVVVLADPALAERPGLTTAQARRAADRVAEAQDSVLSQVAAEPTHRYDTALNGFSVDLSAAEVRALRADPEVRAVTPVRELVMHEDPTQPEGPGEADLGLQTSLSPEFLGLRGEGGVWERVGGQDQAGRDQVVGVVDSGVDWQHPAFDATGLAPPTGWSGVCDGGEDVADWPAEACTDKLVGARAFVEGMRAAGGVPLADESVSPQDTDSHGTHVASIAVGRERTAQGLVLAGVAPSAHLAVYKVCWRYTLGLQERAGCFEDDVLAAVEAAVEDGVDVLNLSLGAPSDPGYGNSAYDFALQGAAAAGVFVAMSAGNSGPGAQTVSNGLPWATTVASARFRSGDPTSVPVVSESSSRGPVNAAPGEQNLLKPDLGAPGVQVLAAVPGGGEDLRSGTSMASPHIAGLAAVLRTVAPTWSPMAMKSAMQTTARDYASAAAPFTGGSGFVEPRRVLDPGLVFDAGAADWEGFDADWSRGYDLNTASVTIGALSPLATTVTRRLTNVTDAEVTYTVGWEGAAQLGVSVTPQQVTVAPGDTAEVQIRVLNRGAPTSAWQAGWLTWRSPSAADVRIPVTARGAVFAPTVDRWSGATRYDTAGVVAAQFPAGTDTVFLASGNGFADALGGSSVAARGLLPAELTGSGAPAPVLLVNDRAAPSERLPAATRAALTRLSPDNIVILGGNAAVPESVRTELEGQGYAVARVAGPDRYATGAALAMLHPPGVPVVYVASGADFPDALTGSAAAARDGGPVLLTRPDRVDPATAEALAHLQPERIVVLGGEAAVSPGVFDAVGADQRLSGTTRFGTASAVAATFTADPDHAYVAQARNWPDALAASALAGAQGAPMLITEQASLPSTTRADLDRLSPQHLVLLGGTAAVSSAVEDTLNGPTAYPVWAAD